MIMSRKGQGNLSTDGSNALPNTLKFPHDEITTETILCHGRILRRGLKQMPLISSHAYFLSPIIVYRDRFSETMHFCSIFHINSI